MITRNHLQQAFHLVGYNPFSAQLRMSPTGRMKPEESGRTDPPRKAGVLALIIERQNEFQIVLTRRTSHLNGHSGQMSFPGGRRDPGDVSYQATALRETCEELGICDANIQILGNLAHVYIPPSHFDVYPTVGLMAVEPVIQPSPDEVAEVVYMPLVQLISPSTKGVMEREFNGKAFSVPSYVVEGHFVWGATAVMLSEIEDRLCQVLPQTYLASLT